MASARAQWGREGSRDRPFSDRYFRLTRTDADACVDDKTWSDLELPEVFVRMDTTMTYIGSQMLYARLRTYAGETAQAIDHHARCEALRTDASARHHIQWALTSLHDDTFAFLVDRIFGAAPPRMRRAYLLPMWSAVCLLVLAGVFALGWPAWLIAVLLVANGWVILRITDRMRRDADTMADCARLLQVAERLATLAGAATPMPQPRRLAHMRTERAEAMRALRWMFRLKGEFMDYIAVWLTLAFLAGPLLYLVALKRFERVRPILGTVFELVGSLDADVALASYLELHPNHCRAEFCDSPRLAIDDGCHPLIARPIGNSLHLDARSALVVGSNMAGKTTFIKMVGINVIFGRTLGFCLASRASVPLAQVMASIRSDHSVASGKSHYLAEMETLRTFMLEAERGTHRLFLLDELFRGTNTVERLAAARAVLEFIGKHAQVLVTTHDVELQQPLTDRYDVYHFKESPDVEGFFDYRLNRGASSERNAIRLLGRLGFPDELVARAMTYATQSAAED